MLVNALPNKHVKFSKEVKSTHEKEAEGETREKVTEREREDRKTPKDRLNARAREHM